MTLSNRNTAAGIEAAAAIGDDDDGGVDVVGLRRSGRRDGACGQWRGVHRSRRRFRRGLGASLEEQVRWTSWLRLGWRLMSYLKICCLLETQFRPNARLYPWISMEICSVENIIVDFKRFG